MTWWLIPFTLVSAIPSGYLVQPVPREADNIARLNTPPCGGLKKGKSHLLAQTNSLNQITWLVLAPSPKGNCTIRLSHGTDYADYEVLSPLDNSADGEGWFPCGRIPDFTDAKIVKFPSDLTCEECTLQWVWQTAQGTYYQCVDVEITGNGLAGCTDKCLNGGVCVDHECECEEGFRGQYCEKDLTASLNSAHFVGMFVLMIVLLAVAGGLAYSTWYIRSHKIPQKTEAFIDSYLPFVMKGRDPGLANAPV